MKNRTILIGLLIILSLVSIGCQSHSVQMTSGKKYISDYSEVEVKEANKTSTDKEVKLVAEIEPSLRFPARIGLVKIYNGKITNLSPEEVESWIKVKEEMGEKFGDFIPVSSMIAEMVYSSQNRNTKRHGNPVEIFRKVRLGAARQHLDYVLVYEVLSSTKTTKLASSIANWTIIGGYLIPSRQIKTTGHANALLLDVKTGYPYGTATATLNANEISAWFNNRDKARNLADKNQMSTVIKLIPEVQQMMKKLMQNSKQV
ncbi:MAG: hypothetical protein P8O23_11145 [Opitutales bacterium]|nr:hypothetical protein [Opitutales bacterium]